MARKKTLKSDAVELEPKAEPTPELEAEESEPASDTAPPAPPAKLERSEQRDDDDEASITARIVRWLLTDTDGNPA